MPFRDKERERAYRREYQRARRARLRQQKAVSVTPEPVTPEAAPPGPAPPALKALPGGKAGSHVVPLRRARPPHTIRDVARLLGRELAAVLETGGDVLMRARVAAQLGRTLIDALKIGDLEARLADLERLAKERGVTR